MPRNARYRTYKKKKKRNVNATPTSYDGIRFASKLEAYCYQALKKARIAAPYEKRSIVLTPDIQAAAPYFASFRDRLIQRTTRVAPITYTPDFEGRDFFIEVKGRKNERYAVVIKLFRLWNEQQPKKKTIYEPKTKEQVDQVIELIKKRK